MQKHAYSKNNQTESLPSRLSSDGAAENPPQPVESLNKLKRRDFLKTGGLALLGISAASTLHYVPWGDIAAASVVVTLPLVIVVLVFQQHIISGLTGGAIKE
jgi:hypothetical protein